MAFKHSKNSVIKVDAGDGSLTTVTAYVDNVEWPEEVSTADTTVLSDSAETSVPGLKSASKVTLSGKYDPTMDALLATLYSNGGQLTAGGSISLEYAPHGTGAGSPKLTGEAWLTEYTPSSPVKDAVKWKATFEITGGQSRTTY